jgi:chromosome partitioning protein
MEVVNELNTFISEAAGKPLPWAGAKIFNSKIRRNIKLAESPSFGQTILKYDPTSNGATDYRALAAEVLAMEGKVVPVIAAPPPLAPEPVITVNPAIEQPKLVAVQITPRATAVPKRAKKPAAVTAVEIPMTKSQ